jgi:hypothetical protein
VTPSTIFVSHRAEYGALVRKLKVAIENTSKGKIKVFISEDIARGEKWRAAIESLLQDSENLFLIYGAPYEDWSWCFYEAGYFAALSREQPGSRHIYCITRPNVPAPGPLSDLQVIINEDQLIDELFNLYGRSDIPYDATEARTSLDKMTSGLFGKLSEYVSYPRVYFTGRDADFRTNDTIPRDAQLTGDDMVLNQLFGIGRSAVTWAEIATPIAHDRAPQAAIFKQKWIDETANIILAARENRFISPQTVLVGQGGRRFRFLLYSARVQGDGMYCCEFLAIDEVGGPALGMSTQLLSLLTSIRMAFRFRSELIQCFPNDFDELSEQERSTRIEEIPRVISNMLTESEATGNINLEDLLSAFDEAESTRMRKLIGYWPSIQKELYKSLGVSADGRVINDSGLRGANVEKFRVAFEALDLLNAEFLSRCCGRVSQKVVKGEAELIRNVAILESKMNMMRGVTTTELRPAA